MKIWAGPSAITGRGMVASEPIEPGDVILDIHADAKLQRPLFHLLNHSCDPNAVVTSRGELKASRFIGRGAEVTLDYVNHCDFTEGFRCECISPNCRVWVEKKLDAEAPRIAPGLTISGQPGAVLVSGRPESEWKSFGISHAP